MTSAVVFFLLIVTMLSAHAERCSSVDLRNTPGGKAMGPVRNQGRMPWCSAYVLSDMLSFKNRECYSPLSLGINYTSGDRGNLWEQVTAVTSGRNMVMSNHWYNFSRMYRGNVGKPICLEKDLPSNDSGAHNTADLITRVGQIRNDLGMFGTCTQDQINVVKGLFPNLSPREIQVIMGTTFATNIHEFLMRSNCARNQRTFPRFEPQYTENLNMIDTQLSAGKLVTISYSSDVLKHPQPPPNKGGHVSSVVGRRMREGKCEYLVRNSWGRGCGGYIYPCEEGNIWVPEERIRAATGGVWYAN